MPGFIGPTELIVFGIIALLLLGPKKLPEMGRSLGKGMREFKESVSGDGTDRTIDVAAFEDTSAPMPTTTGATTTTASEAEVTAEVAR